MKFYEYINDTLKSYGCRKAFGLSGSLVMPVWQNLKDVELIMCSHEQEVSYVAAGYSKASGEPVAVITTGGPATTNCASGIALANIDSIPMIYISGRTPARMRGYGLRQEESNINRGFNSVDALSPLTKEEIEINDISKASKQFSDGCEIATSGRPGVVHISIDIEIQSLDLPSYKVATPKKEEPTIPELPEITKPLIILGWGSWQSGSVEQIYKLAEKIEAPVLVTTKGYSCIWGNHPNYLGKLGYAYNPVLEKYLQEYAPEQILAFGASMARRDIPESCLEILKSAETYLYSIECNDIKQRFPNGHWTQVNDMTAMVRSWVRKAKPTNNNHRLDLESVRNKQREYYTEKIDDGDLMSRAIVELNSMCDDSCIITADAGNNLIDTAILYEPKKYGGMFLDASFRAMGSSLTASVGMSIAREDKYVIAVVGDGGMLMNGNVMYLAKRLNLPILFLVINNSAHGRIRVGQMNQQRFIGTDLGNIDFDSYGKAYGLKTYKAKSIPDFRDAMEKILKEKKTTILELCTDKDEIPISLKGKELF